MKNGVNRCGTNIEKERGGVNGEKKGRAGIQHSWRYLFMSRVRKRYTFLQKCMYNLQARNYFNYGAKYRANVDKSARISCYAKKNKRNLFISRDISFKNLTAAHPFIEMHFWLSQFRVTLFLNVIVAGKELPVIVSRNNCRCLLKKLSSEHPVYCPTPIHVYDLNTMNNIDLSHKAKIFFSKANEKTFRFKAKSRLKR